MQRALRGSLLGAVVAILIGGGPACSDDSATPDGPGTKSDGPQVRTEGGTPDQGGAQPDLKIGDTTCNPSWGATDACGGNLAGTWKYLAVCVGGGFFYPITTLCPSATLSNQAVVSNGTLTTTATSFTRKVTGTVTTDATIPATCAIGGCTVLETAIKTAVAGGTATCTGSQGGPCNCKLGFPINVDDSGTYTTAGGVVTAVPNGGTSSKYHYCVKDNVLRYRGLASNPTAQKEIVYVLTR